MDKGFEVTEAVKGIDPDLVEGDGFSGQATLLAAMVGSVPTWYAVMALCMPLVGGLLGALSWGNRGPLRFRP